MLIMVGDTSKSQNLTITFISPEQAYKDSPGPVHRIQFGHLTKPCLLQKACPQLHWAYVVWIPIFHPWQSWNLYPTNPLQVPHVQDWFLLLPEFYWEECSLFPLVALFPSQLDEQLQHDRQTTSFSCSHTIEKLSKQKGWNYVCKLSLHNANTRKRLALYTTVSSPNNYDVAFSTTVPIFKNIPSTKEPCQPELICAPTFRYFLRLWTLLCGNNSCF